MKKLLTILALLLTVASQGWADREITLWEGSTALDWNADPGIEVVINNDLLKLAEIGSIIKIEGSNDNSGSMQLCVNSPSWGTLAGSIGTFPYSYTVNSDKINSIKKSSLTIQGANVTITKVTMTIPEEFIVWEGSVAINWGANPGVSLDIDGEYFSNLEIGSQIVVTGTQTSGRLKMSKRYPWVDLVDISSDLTLPYTYTVPYEYADKITTDNGLSFQGQDVTITKIEKKESNVIWLATTETLENVNIVSRKLENIAIGNRLKITKTNKELSDGTLSVSYNNGTENVEVCSMQSWDGEKEIEVTSTNIDYIKQNGLYLTGSNLAKSKIELDTSDPEAASSIDPEKFVKLWNTTPPNTPSQSITFSSAWGGAGWNIGDNRYNEAQSITVALSDAPTTPLNLVLEYVTTDGAVLTNTSNYGNSTDGFTASSTVSVPQSDLLKIRKLYIQNPDATTTITLSSVKIATSVLNNDMSVYEVASSVFSSALVGDKIKITYSSISSGDMTLKVGTTDGGTDVLASGTVTGTSKEIEITASTLANIKSNGLYLRGYNITISNVELVAVPPFTGDDNLKTANLARFVEAGASYDGNGTITTPADEEYKGVKLTLSEGQYVSGTRLIVNFQSATNAKVHVNYVGKSWGDGSENTGNGTQLIVPLNINNEVSEIIIQIVNSNTTATLTGVSVDNTCMLTTAAVNGNISMTYTGGAAATGTEFPYGTGLTLTATANGHFVFSKWKKNGEDAGTSSTLAITMDGNVSVDALFKATPLNNGETLTVWSGATTGQSWGEELQITSEITDILERFETIKITASRIATSETSPNYKVFLSTLGTTTQIGNFECNDVTDGQVVEFSLSTDALVNLLKEGFGICVQNTKITKVELYKPNIPVALADEETREVWSNSTGAPLNWGNNEISISALDAHILEAGEQVIITTEKTGDWPKAWLADGSAAVSPTIEGTECKITLTSALVDQIKNGFYVSGGDATAKKIEFYKPVVIFIDGKANLDRGTESSGSTTLTAPHDEAVTGNVMVVNLTETNPDAKVKVTYSDGSSIEIAPSKRKVGTPTATQVVVPLNMEKYIKSVSVNTAKAKISEIYMTTISAFEADASNFVADLSLAKAQDNVLYNPSTYTIAASTGWTGIALSKNSADADIKGAEVKITFEGDAQVKTTVYYTDDTNTGDAGSMSEAASSQKLKIDATKTIREIQIQPTSASVVQLKEVRVNATETEDEPEGGDDDEPIIDEKTGETDLTELAAQDGTKTTLTQNEDGSITMTTTEAYCAAQIWFSDPEPVAGNVLKVELAESKVNVTVTVKYTDGTESQMSANTKTVVSARATTRAVASGTTIEVPLETGKEVQNIEVKNNEAGTITIKKMQVTTINVFTGGVANLAMLKPQSNATYDTSAHTLATTKGWTGATISPVDGENVSGKELLIEFADASKVKVAVKYRTDVEGPSTIMEKAAKAVRLALDNTKNIQEISIQPTEASIVTFKKIAVNSEESDDGTLKPGKTITLWESATGETLSWNEVAKQDASVGEMLKEYDELLITVSGVVKDCDWPKLFIRDASSEQAGNEVLLNDVGSFPYTVRIVLTGEMAQQLQKGFSICGDGVTVKKLQVYRPEAPKTGDIHLADLNYGYNSSYDKGSHTITTTARWAARGWEIGDKRYNDKNLITVKFEAVDFPVTLKMEYTTGLQTAQATSVGVPAGRTELLLEIPKGISKLNRVYIIYENPGSVKLTEASVTYMENLKLSTAIQAFEADGVIRDGRYDTDGWYNLRGMRIPEPKTSGIYIHGGKKVVIY